MVVASMALGLLQAHFGVPGQPLGMVDVMGFGLFLEALLLGSFEERWASLPRRRSRRSGVERCC